MNEQQKNTLVIVGFVGVLALLGVGYYHYFFARGSIQSYANRVATVDKDMAEKSKQYNEIKRIMADKEEMERKKAQVELALKRLPTSKETQGFMQAIYSVLRKTGLLQQSLKPKALVDQSQYTEVPYAIMAHGRYHELGQFLMLIEQNKDRFMRLKRLKMTNNLDRPSIHPIEMDIATFMFKEAAVAAASAAPAKPAARGRR